MRKRTTTTKVKKAPQERNPNGHYESICKYHVAEIYDEVRVNVDCQDYDSILNWILQQPYSKVKFCVDKAADLPIILKTIASSLLSDIKYGRIQTTQMAMERLLGKPVERQHVAITDNSPLQIEVINDADNEEIKKLCCK